MRAPQVLRDRRVRLLWYAKVASEVGDWAGRLSLAALLYMRTGWAGAAAAVTVASLAPYLGPGQVITARAERIGWRSTLVGADLLRAVIYLALALVPMPAAAMLALTFVAGAATPPFEAARSGLLPTLTGPAGYGRALAFFASTYQGALLAGYLAGGWALTGLGARAALGLNAGTFLISAALIAAIPGIGRADTGSSAPRHDTARALARAGRTLWVDPMLRTVVGLVTVAALTSTVAEALVVVTAQRDLHHLGWAGPLAALVPAAGLAASLVLPHAGSHRFLLRVGAGVTAAGSGLLVAATLAAAAAGPRTSPALLLGGYAVAGVMSVITVPLGTVLGNGLPTEGRATAFSLAQGLLMATQSAAAAVAGVAVAGHSMSTVLAVAAVPGLLGALAALATTGRRA